MTFQVLIIDDETGFQTSLTRLFSDLDCVAECCGDVDSARQCLKSGKYHLIVLDLCLVGDTYTQESKDFVTWVIKKYPGTPKLITSGKQISKEIMFEMGRYAKYGNLEFIEKGTFELKDFREKVERLLQKYQMMRILHLSDIHLGNSADALKYKVQLKIDLIKNFNIDQIDYLVISGDIANTAAASEYAAGVELVQGIMRDFKIDSSRLVIVPGNHDLSWELSEGAYKYVKNGKIPPGIEDESWIPAGDNGKLIRDESLYPQRFSPFNEFFYQKLMSQSYPMESERQGINLEFPNDKILFLTLNSAWKIDHHFHNRAEINSSALSNGLDTIVDTTYDDWFKIAVWHHPVTGLQMMPDDFLELLARNGFQICLHGHIHEAREGFYKYDDDSGMHLIGAGTFGAPASQLVSGIPFQYNLLILDRKTGEMRVETRKKVRANGAWSADAIWGNKNNPRPYYSFSLRQPDAENEKVSIE